MPAITHQGSGDNVLGDKISIGTYVGEQHINTTKQDALKKFEFARADETKAQQALQRLQYDLKQQRQSGPSATALVLSAIVVLTLIGAGLAISEAAAAVVIIAIGVWVVWRRKRHLRAILIIKQAIAQQQETLQVIRARLLEFQREADL